MGESETALHQDRWLREMLALVNREPQQDRIPGKTNQQLIAEFTDERGMFAA